MDFLHFHKLDLIVTKKNPKIFDLETDGLQDIADISLKVEQIFCLYCPFFLLLLKGGKLGSVMCPAPGIFLQEMY